MKDILDYTKLITQDTLKVGGLLQGADLSKTSIPGIQCPKCKNGELKQSEKNYYCSNYPKKNADRSSNECCTFTIWKLIAEKKLTENSVRQLTEKGKSSLVKGFKSKTGKAFNAYLVLKDDWQIGLEFEQKFHNV